MATENWPLQIATSHGCLAEGRARAEKTFVHLNICVARRHTHTHAFRTKLACWKEPWLLAQRRCRCMCDAHVNTDLDCVHTTQWRDRKTQAHNQPHKYVAPVKPHGCPRLTLLCVSSTHLTHTHTQTTAAHARHTLCVSRACCRRNQSHRADSAHERVLTDTAPVCPLWRLPQRCGAVPPRRLSGWLQNHSELS